MCSMREQLIKALEGNPHMLPKGFDLDDWLKTGIVLQDGEDFALFEPVMTGVYLGHYLFKSRGKKAVLKAKKFLEEAFFFSIAIIGEVPNENKAALWLTRHLGFTEFDKDNETTRFFMTRN